MDPQDFLAKRLNDVKDLLTGETSYQDTVSFLAPGGIAGKLATKGGFDMLRSAGKPGASKMSLLGGDAPVYESDVDEFLDSPIREVLPGVSGAIGYSPIKKLNLLQ